MYSSLRQIKFVALVLITASIAGCAGHSNSQNGSQAKKQGLAFAPDNGGLKLPPGFQAIIVAPNIGSARHIVVRDNGDIYVALKAPQNGHSIACLRDTSGDGAADIIEYFGEGHGNGIAIHDGYLYFASDTSVVRYKFDGNNLLPDPSPQTIATFPVQHEHEMKSITFDNDENMYVNIGAPSNACQYDDRQKGSPGQNPCPLLAQHAGIWRFKANQFNQTEENGGYRYATGLRNCVGLTWNQDVNKLYAVMNGRDQLYQLFPQYYTVKQGAELPAEEFFLIKDGGNYGWPYTYYDQFQKKLMIAPEYGGNGKKAAPAGKYDDPIMAFPGHWAPVGLMFYTDTLFPSNYDNGAFIAFHGSWNRAPLPQEGYKVVFVPFKGDMPAGSYIDFADNFSGSPDNSNPKHRPVGLAEGPHGSLYITDDLGGTVWRIVYTGKK
jgi:glucose/arabinose dehydrogenase